MNQPTRVRNWALRRWLQPIRAVKLLVPAALVIGFGESLQAQTPVTETVSSPLSIEFAVEDGRVTIAPQVVNSAADSLLGKCSISVERLGATGNRSRSSQSSAVTLASGESQTIGRSTTNFVPGDRLIVQAELRSASGELIAVSQLDEVL